MRDVAIVGTGCTEFGEMWDTSFRSLFIEAGVQALTDADVKGKEIDEIYIGNMSAGRFIAQEHVAALISDYSGMSELHVPATRVEAACASGGLALRQGYMAVASGISDVVVVGGVEKMTDVVSNQSIEILAAASDREWEAFYGATFPGLYAMIANRHMYEFETKREHLAKVAVKNHYNATMNPKAQFQREISMEQVLNATKVADPLTLFDSSPITDGAAALVLVPAEKADEYTDTPIYINGAGQASDTISLHDRRDICTIDATVEAAKTAYKMADVGPEDIDVAEVHDCFTIAEILATEDLGFCGKGEGGMLLEEGATELDGDIPINPSGGLKACGHPVGATGIKQAVEITSQLKGEAGDRQVESEIGLCHNVGGSGGTATVHILSREA
ncbi:thiolase domain-containing protein [Methanonatronarchaeum sp. AMET6-2]|uniref:thiolase domain-containing protein n=1 Tax=Methanonatronarchaeum sp. AMET6-2 TaxID=2933293 RepID=UPI0012215C1D|nr:thiolase domain-containing protein [Methanonatronarchaeum sp. AMET6-2]RZN62441.1 MAG: thiolase domain-containing protein [Methanonatronarchaeia archaeon]UOY09686.1 thiolase domain-containing protein [Methanonatronarchaeum sp. AMET6-2]